MRHALYALLFPAHALAWNILVSWDANPSAPINGYLISYGTKSGVYDRQVDAGYTNERLIVPHSQTSRVYISVRAYNYGGTSPHSKQVIVDPPVGASPTATLAPRPDRPVPPTGVKAVPVPEE